jgi:hypothetical protein
MGLFNWLGKSKREQESVVDSRAERSLFGDDDAYHRNFDVAPSLEFHATLQIRTPLWILEHHGELFSGPPSQAPKYGTEADGIWLPKVAWASVGVAPPPESSSASDVGPVRPQRYLPFLKDFRRTVEQPNGIDDKLAGLERLSHISSSYAAFWKKLKENIPDFPESFFYMGLADVPGIGPGTARNLYRSGVRTTKELRVASDKDLLKVQGMGQGTLRKVREYFRHGNSSK